MKPNNIERYVCTLKKPHQSPQIVDAIQSKATLLWCTHTQEYIGTQTYYVKYQVKIPFCLIDEGVLCTLLCCKWAQKGQQLFYNSFMQNSNINYRI